MKRTCTGSLAYPLPKKQRDNGNWTTLGRYDVMNLDEVLAWLQSLGNPQMLKEWNASGSGSGKLGGTRTGFAAAGPADWHWLNASSGKSEVGGSAESVFDSAAFGLRQSTVTNRGNYFRICRIWKRMFL